jgi:prepilin-type N-terminal cleavage/methylation domain-containing protein
MNKRFLPKSIKNNHHGFSMTEVLVSILVLTLFTLTATSLMVYAAQNRVSARSDGEVTDQLQQLMEGVRDEAAALSLTDAERDTACRATTTTMADGFGQKLKDSLRTVTVTVSDNDDRDYTVTRLLNPVNIAPFDRLEVIYTITPQGSTNPSDTITMTTEIIPNVAFQCP